MRAPSGVASTPASAPGSESPLDCEILERGVATPFPASWFAFTEGRRLAPAVEQRVPSTADESAERPELEVIARLLRSPENAGASVAGAPRTAEGGAAGLRAPVPASAGTAPAHAAWPIGRAEANGPEPGAKLVAGRYEILGLLGEGADGRVFRVRDHQGQGRELALKILLAAKTHRPDFEERLEAWLEERGRLAQDAIVRLRDAGRTDLGLWYLATDLVRGQSLRELLAARGALHPRHALEITRQVLLGLEHGRGLVHGGLHAGNVHLAERVPSTDENPFGVGVRLLDHGLAVLLLRDADVPEPSVEDDLRAVGRLLLEMLSGAASEEGTYAGDDALPAGISLDLHDLVRRALLPASEGGFRSASTFRRELDELPELRPSAAPRNPWRVAALVLAPALLVTAGLWWRARGPALEAASRPDETAALRATQLEDERAALEQELAAARAELASARVLAPMDEPDGAAAAERERRAELEGRIAELETELGLWKQRSTTHESRASRLEEAQGRARGRIELLEGELTAALHELDDVASQSRARELALQPEYAAASLFDRALMAGEDDPVQALELFEQEKRAGALAAGPWPGEGFVALWLETRAALARARESTSLEARSAELERAVRAEAEARARRPAFAEEAAGWLACTTDLIDASVRLQEVDRVLDLVHDELAAERARLAPELERRWQALQNGDLDRAPEEVLAVTRWSEDGRLVAWLERYAGWLQELSGSGEELDLVALGGVRGLDRWAETVAERPELLAVNPGREVRLFAWARRFHDSEHEAEGLPPGPVVHQGPGGGSPLSGWRAELELKARLLAEDSAFPGPPGARFLYRTLTREGTTSWQLETVLEDPAPPPDAIKSRLVEQRFYDAQGRFLQDRQKRLVQRGKRFTEEDVRQITVLDLVRQEGFSRHYWTPEKTPELPDGLPVRAERINAFRERLNRQGWHCLVAAQGAKLTWYSPSLGLVRFEDPATITRELIYAELGEEE